MRIKSAHLRLVGSILAAVVLLPVVGQWFVELASAMGLYQHPVERVRAVIVWLSDLTAHTAFHWLGGGVIGFFVGVWLDALVRRGETASDRRTLDEIFAASTQTWMTPEEARAKLLPPDVEEKIQAARDDFNAKSVAANEARDFWSDHADDEGLQQHFQELSTVASLAEQPYSALCYAAGLQMIEWLRDGLLIAKGVERVNGRAEDEKPIPPEYWRFMSLNVVEATAGGHGRTYLGVLITKPLVV